MSNLYSDEISYSPDYDINVRMIAFTVITIVLIIVMIFFIKTYATQKQQVLKMLDYESNLLDTFCNDSFNHNAYIIKLISSKIQKSYKSFQGKESMEYIYDTLKFYDQNGNLYTLFGWEEIIWLDDKLIPKVSSTRGLLDSSKPINSIYVLNSKFENDKIFYGIDLDSPENRVMYSSIGLHNEQNEFIGALIIKYDLTVLSSQLSNHKKHDFTNFILIDSNYQIILQSKPNITGFTIANRQVSSKYTNDLLKTISIKNDDGKKISYLDMVNGVNYFMKKIKNQPFLLLINIDHNEIKTTIFHTVVMKFLEISIFASFFLLMIVAIYRRETWLRNKAEDASKVALRATNAKSDFLAFTAHEIRSPLGFIMTGSDMIKQEVFGTLNSKYKEYASGINYNARLILEFITDILDEEHIISGNFKIISHPENIQNIIEQSMQINLTRYSSRKIDITKHIESNMPSLICDGRRILQILNNLLSNGIKYSQDGTIITIEAFVKNHSLFIKVIDQGIGMTEEEVKIALTKYGTMNKKNFSFIESYGLGLPIVKLLLDAHEATMEIESKVNIGTTITLIFPENRLQNEPQ
jgi:signal transduction histidine kinase